MSIALFRFEAGKIVPLPAAIGPWMPNVLSGTAVGPLFAALAEDIPTPCPMLAARLSIEFLRPVPMRPLDADTRIIRQGRKQQILHIKLSADGKEVTNATVLRLRSEDDGDAPAPGRVYIPPSFEPFRSVIKTNSPLLSYLDWHPLHTNSPGNGFAEIWLRSRATIIEGRPLTPLTRAAHFADFGNGISHVVSPDNFSYLNADITLHLARLPQGEWLKLRARTVNGDNGLAMVETEIGDGGGTVGWAHQALLLEPRS